MKIYSDDGKVFNSVDECNAYESDLALKKQKEEAERKKKIEKRNSQIKDIESAVDYVNEVVEEFTKSNDENVYLSFNNNKLNVRIINKANYYVEFLNNFKDFLA